jgi:hypothetical protein
MPDQPTDTNRNAIKVAIGAALGSALGIITAVRTLSGGKRAAGSGQQAVDSGQAVLDQEANENKDGHTENATVQQSPQFSVLSSQSFPTHPDWERLPPAHLPRPTYWPVVLAFGIVLLAWGVVTTLAITVIGLVLFALGLGGWIGELRHGHE